MKIQLTNNNKPTVKYSPLLCSFSLSLSTTHTHTPHSRCYAQDHKFTTRPVFLEFELHAQFVRIWNNDGGTMRTVERNINQARETTLCLEWLVVVWKWWKPCKCKTVWYYHTGFNQPNIRDFPYSYTSTKLSSITWRLTKMKKLSRVRVAQYWRTHL